MIDGRPVLRFGIIGLGRAWTSFLPSLVRHPHVRIVAGADPRPEARALFAQEFEAKVYDNSEALCEDPNVDAVYIATPHTFHASHAIAAVQRGKHVIVEKPMALSLEDCDHMIDAAARAGVVLVVGHSHGYDPPILKMREIICSGELGAVRMISAWNYKNFIYTPLRPDELDPALGGGVVFNQGPHQIDQVRWLGGGLVRSVRASTFILDPSRPVEGAYCAFLAFENGAAAVLTFNGYGRFDSDEFHWWIGENGMPKSEDTNVQAKRQLRGLSRDEEAALKAATGYGGARQRVIEPRGVDQRRHPHFGITLVSCERADLRPSANGVLIYDDEGVREIPVPLGPAAKSETVNELYDAVVTGRPASHDGRWGKATLEVALAIHQSAKEGREVFLSCQVPTPDDRISVDI